MRTNHTPRSSTVVTVAAVTMLLATSFATMVPATHNDKDPVQSLPEGSYQLEDGRWATPLGGDSPAWYTPNVHQKVLAAAELGMGFDVDKGEAVTLASQYAFIRPGAWMLSPSWCTMNFIYGNPGRYHIGSAGHCNDVGDPVIIAAAPSVIVAIGTTKRSHDGGIGNDWSLTLVSDQFQQFVDPNVAVINGPQGGAYTGDASITSPVFLKHFGHGIAVGTGGTPRNGVSTDMDNKAVWFDSPAAPGDSGSPILVAASATNPLGQAVGILTHLVIGTKTLPSVMAGTRVTAVSMDVVDGDVNPLP